MKAGTSNRSQALSCRSDAISDTRARSSSTSLFCMASMIPGLSSMSASRSSVKGRSTCARPCSSAQSLPFHPSGRGAALTMRARGMARAAASAVSSSEASSTTITSRLLSSWSSASRVRVITAASLRAGISTDTSERSPCMRAAASRSLLLHACHGAANTVSQTSKLRRANAVSGSGTSDRPISAISG